MVNFAGFMKYGAKYEEEVQVVLSFWDKAE